ncbi:MAG: DMT family transporter [Nitrospinota bacterium]
MTLDAAAAFALSSALCFTAADMFARRGLQGRDPLAGAVFTLLGELAFLFGAALVLGLRFPPLGPDYLRVAAGGAGNPGLFMIFFLVGISKIGVARAAPIKGSSPLVGAFLAVIFLGERPAWYHLAGVVFVAGGVATLSSGRTHGRWRRADALWPVAAAVAAGAGAVFWRSGLKAFPHPLAGSVVGVVTAALMVAGFAWFRLGGRRIAQEWRKGPVPFLLCGVAAGLGIFLYVNAFQRGEVYRLLPLIQTSPLYTVLIALVFFRRAEHLTWRVPAGAVLTLAGAALVTLRPGG